MPLTRYPNGVTTCSTTALKYSASAGDGDMDCLRLFTSGTTSIGGAATIGGALIVGGAIAGSAGITMSTNTSFTFIGERVYIPFTFTSAAITTYLATPIAGQVIDCWVCADTTPRTCSAFTLFANGTAGTVCVASVATLVFATAIGQQIQPVLTPAAQTLATGLAIVVTTAGSACNFSGVITLQRTA